MNMEKMLSEALKKASDYALAYNSHEKKKAELKALKNAANQAMSDYNLQLSKEVYRAWDKEGDPVKIAIRSLYVPGAKKLKFQSDADDNITAMLDSAMYKVSLPQMQATLGDRVFTDPKWFNKAEKLCFITANVVNSHVSGTEAFVYDIDEASKEFDFPNDTNPETDEGVLHALQVVFDSILYIDNPDNPGTNLILSRIKEDEYGRKYSQEWEYIKACLVNKSGDKSLTVGNTGNFTRYILECMNKIMTNDNFSVGTENQYIMPEADEADADKE